MDEREDLRERVAELESALAELQSRVGGPSRGPRGLPRPPTPGELRRLTADYTIPALVATLEAQIRALELLRELLHATDPARSSGARDRVAELGEDALGGVADVLDDLERVLAAEETPADPEARELLSEARRLRGEIRDRLAEVPAERARERERERERGTEIDVEAELETIKEELDDEGQAGSNR
ncbi:MAG: hypothetical protein ABEJ04_06900 [Halobacteriaceae archaeon]